MLNAHPNRVVEVDARRSGARSKRNWLEVLLCAGEAGGDGEGEEEGKVDGGGGEEDEEA